MNRNKIVKAAKWLIEQIIKKPSGDRTNNYLARPQSTARLIWACEEIIENKDDWSLEKLNRELGIVTGLLASKLFEGKEESPDYVTLLKIGVHDAAEENQYLKSVV